MTESPLVLVVDDEPAVCRVVSSQLARLGYETDVAANAKDALAAVRNRSARPALVISDVNMPQVSGVELLHEIKVVDESIQVVMMTAMSDLDTVRECLREGACDYLIKPFQAEELQRTVDRSLERFRLLEETRHYQLKLEQMVLDRTREARQTRDIALMTLGRLAESRDRATGRHLERIGAYTALLATALAFTEKADLDDTDIDRIERSSALHDIGKVAVPDAILLKPGSLTPEERAIMQTHTTVGGDTLRQIIEGYEGHRYLHLAMHIAYSHHERWDGHGYPAGLSGEEIPLAARIVAVCDAYDAITSDRPYQEALSHAEAVRRVTIDSGEHFDPDIVSAFLSCSSEFETIGRKLGDTHV